MFSQASEYVDSQCCEWGHFSIKHLLITLVQVLDVVLSRVSKYVLVKGQWIFCRVKWEVIFCCSVRQTWDNASQTKDKFHIRKHYLRLAYLKVYTACEISDFHCSFVLQLLQQMDLQVYRMVVVWTVGTYPQTQTVWQPRIQTSAFLQSWVGYRRAKLQSNDTYMLMPTFWRCVQLPSISLWFST
jgi:hypothetical protein